MPFDGTRLFSLRSVVRTLNPPAIRYASRYSAIQRGILAESRPAPREPRDTRQHARPRKIGWSPVKAERATPRPKGNEPPSVSPAGVSPDRRRRANFAAQPSYGSRKHTKASTAKGEQSTEHVKLETGSKRIAKQENKAIAAPHTLPFTTAASEFLYGHSAVIAALTASRRKLYKLYLHPRANKESSNTETIEQLCRQSGVTIVHVDNRWLHAMDRAADDRPHNVCLPSAPRILSCQPS